MYASVSCTQNKETLQFYMQLIKAYRAEMPCNKLLLSLLCMHKINPPVINNVAMSLYHIIEVIFNLWWVNCCTKHIKWPRQLVCLIIQRITVNSTKWGHCAHSFIILLPDASTMRSAVVCTFKLRKNMFTVCVSRNDHNAYSCFRVSSPNCQLHSLTWFQY